MEFINELTPLTQAVTVTFSSGPRKVLIPLRFKYYEEFYSYLKQLGKLNAMTASIVGGSMGAEGNFISSQCVDFNNFIDSYNQNEKDRIKTQPGQLFHLRDTFAERRLFFLNDLSESNRKYLAVKIRRIGRIHTPTDAARVYRKRLKEWLSGWEYETITFFLNRVQSALRNGEKVLPLYEQDIFPELPDTFESELDKYSEQDKAGLIEVTMLELIEEHQKQQLGFEEP